MSPLEKRLHYVRLQQRYLLRPPIDGGQCTQRRVNGIFVIELPPEQSVELADLQAEETALLQEIRCSSSS